MSILAGNFTATGAPNQSGPGAEYVDLVIVDLRAGAAPALCIANLFMLAFSPLLPQPQV
jgi:hypothetical protein